MTDIPPSAFLLAGFTLAHAMWSVSDTKPDELLVPLAIVDHDGKRTLQRFEAATQLEAITRGKDAMTKATPGVDAWAFARENAQRESPSDDVTQDVISVDFWRRGMAKPVTIVQQFERAGATQGFHVVGSPVVAVDGKELDGAEAGPYITTLMKGVFDHSKVAPLWPTWK